MNLRRRRARVTGAGEAMPLDERERRILEEIERQFYEEDPKLVETVRKTSLATVGRRNLRRATVGLILGVAVMLATFMRYPLIALLGFGLMVASAWFVVTTLKRRTGQGSGGDGTPDRVGAWLKGLREKWRFGR
ncbi:MAG: DUF3040 domain-containing protein [Actinomycetota bacterium]|nr:DUF3040 domain-containing protein [Actinomycetota bacterium]